MQGKMGAYEASTLSLSGDTDRTLSRKMCRTCW